MNSMFTIRSYGRTELAQLYAPHLQPFSAYRKLMSWIRLNPTLRPLANQKQRCFTPAQVAKIIEVLGEP